MTKKRNINPNNPPGVRPTLYSKKVCLSVWKSNQDWFTKYGSKGVNILIRRELLK